MHSGLEVKRLLDILKNKNIIKKENNKGEASHENRTCRDFYESCSSEDYSIFTGT